MRHCFYYPPAYKHNNDSFFLLPMIRVLLDIRFLTLEAEQFVIKLDGTVSLIATRLLPSFLCNESARLENLLWYQMAGGK